MTSCELVGRNIRRFRKTLGYTIEGYAHFLQISSNYLSEVERGEQNFTMDYLDMIADGMKLPTIYFMYEWDKHDFESYVHTPDSEYRYLLMPGRYFDKESKARYMSYGIVAEFKHRSDWIKIGYVPDIDTDENTVIRLIERFNRDQLPPISLMDMVNDLMGEYDERALSLAVNS